MQSLKGNLDVEKIRETLLQKARSAGTRMIGVRGVDLEAAICGRHPQAAAPAATEQTAESPKKSAKKKSVKKSSAKK